MNCKKIAASILAFTLITGAAASNNSVINSIIPTNTIVAEAAISYGDWEFEIQPDNTAIITKYKGNGTIITIPGKVKDTNSNKTYTVTALKTSLFQNNNMATSISVPSSVTEIPKLAFCNAANLTNVNLPSGIKKIGNKAFYGTIKLTNISFPSTLEEICNNAFKKSGLTSLNFPEKLKKIESYAFANTCITSVSFPASLKEIDHNAFSNTKLTSVTLPDTLTYIGDYAFENCTQLKRATIRCTGEIGKSIFRNCNKITNVTLNTNSVQATFRNGALGYCPNLKTINNIQILKKDSNGKLYFNSKFEPYIKLNFAALDNEHVSFYDEYLDFMIKDVVRKETAGCTTDAQKLRKLHDWVCNKVDYAYIPDPNNEKKLIPDPSSECHVDSSVFMRDTTVCVGYARALTLLLREAGIEAYYLGSSTHAWTMVRIGSRYFHVDACHDGQSSTTKYSHFLKSDTDIKKCASGHSSWNISISSSRCNYDIPTQTPVCEYSVGDVNMDGKINKADADCISKYITFEYSIPDITLADVNGDGTVDVDDQVTIYDLF